jgi:hypothetical protein
LIFLGYTALKFTELQLSQENNYWPFENVSVPLTAFLLKVVQQMKLVFRASGQIPVKA